MRAPAALNSSVATINEGLTRLAAQPIATANLAKYRGKSLQNGSVWTY